LAYRKEKESKLPSRSCVRDNHARADCVILISRSLAPVGRTLIATSADVEEKRGCRFESMPHYRSDSKHNNGANSLVITHCADITRLSLTWKYKSPSDAGNASLSISCSFQRFNGRMDDNTETQCAFEITQSSVCFVTQTLGGVKIVPDESLLLER